MTDDSTPPERGPSAPAAGEPQGQSLGAALAAARTARGLSVEDVASATRIRAALIRGIEADDFSRSGGAVYARGHIKSIAQVVGADGRELVARFDRKYDNPVPTLTASPMPALPAFEPPAGAGAGSRPSARWASVAIGVLVVAVLFLAVSWIAGRGHRPSSGGVAAPTPTSTPAAPSAPPSASTSPSPTPAPKGVLLRVRAADGDSWLLVTASSGAQVYEGILTAGRVMDFRDGRALTVKFGNSRAVTLTLNGRDLGAPRCGSIVCSLQFAPNSATAG